MHAVVVRARVEDVEASQQALQSEIVPRASQLPGFKAGYWTRGEEGGAAIGLSMAIFDSEENAKAAAESVPSIVSSAPVTLESVEVREVVASA